MKTITSADLQSDVNKYLKLAAEDDVVITENGQPVGLLSGLTSEDELFDAELESHPLFLARVKRARQQFREGKGIRIEDIRAELLQEE